MKGKYIAVLALTAMLLTSCGEKKLKVDSAAEESMNSVSSTTEPKSSDAVVFSEDGVQADSACSFLIQMYPV